MSQSEKDDLKHIAWDYAVLSVEFKFLANSTLCDKSVDSQHIDSKNPTCEDCLAYLVTMYEVAHLTNQEKFMRFIEDNYFQHLPKMEE